MGYYINSATLTKEDWLKQNAQPTNEPEFPADDDIALICLVDNGAFTAAGIAFSRQEMAEFANPSDLRPKTWYLAFKDDLAPVVPAFNSIPWEKA